jgi:hypothetical protein
MNAFLRSGAVVSVAVMLSCVVTPAQDSKHAWSTFAQHSPAASSMVVVRHYDKRPLPLTTMKGRHKRFAGACISGPVQGMCGLAWRETLLFYDPLTSREVRQSSHPHHMLLNARLRRF